MADNKGITTGSDATVATDEIAGVDYQRIKLVHGVDGTNDGDVSTTNGLPVKDVLGTIDYGGTSGGNLFSNATTAGFSSILTLSGKYTTLSVKTEFDDSGDYCVVEPWWVDGNAASGWNVGASYTASSTTIGHGSGPGSAACLASSSWFFGKGFELNVKGFTKVCFYMSTAPSTAGVKMWGDPV